MPRKNYAKKAPKKRVYKKPARSKKYRPQGTPSGMPLTRRSYMRYTDRVVVTSTSGTIGTHIFRANSVFDPDLTVAGHQPMGFDQWIQLYNHYVVVGAKITVQAVTDSGQVNPSAYGINLQADTPLAYTDFTGFIEAKQGTTKYLVGGSSVMPKPIYSSYSARKFFNITNIKDNLDRLGSPVGANPNEGAYFVLYYQLLTAISDSQWFTISIDYIVDWSEPRMLSQS